jgi:hypothetical protein
MACRRSQTLALAQVALLALLWSVRTVDRSRPEGERDNRYNAQALFIAELGLLPTQLAKPKCMTVFGFPLWS